MKISLLNLDIILMTKIKQKFNIIIYNLECTQCRTRANLEVLKMEFNQKEKSVLTLVCKCTFCNEHSVIDAEIAQWGEIRGYPLQRQDENSQPKSPQKTECETSPIIEE